MKRSSTVNSMNAWPMLPIGELLTKVSRPVEVSDAETYREIGIRSHCKGIFHKPPVNGKELGDKRVFWVEPGCLVFNIIFAWEQAVAVTSDAEKGMIASHRFPMYRGNGKLLPEYACLYYSSPRGKYDLNIASPGGAGRNKTLGQEEFKRLELPVPPVKYQRQTVDALATWVRAIDVTQKLIAAKRRHKQGLAQRLLTGECRLPGFSKVWSKHEFGEIASPSSSRCEPKSAKKGSRCIELEHLSQGDGRILGTVEAHKQLSLKAVFNTGDVLFGKLRPNLRKSYLCEFSGLCSTEIWVLQPKETICCSKYLAQLVQSHRFIAAACVTAGSKMPRAEWSYVAEVPFDLPPLDEQEKIAAVLEAIDREVTVLTQQLTLLIDQKKGLMQKLLNGSVKVTQ